MLGNFTTSQLHKARIGVYPRQQFFLHLSPARFALPKGCRNLPPLPTDVRLVLEPSPHTRLAAKALRELTRGIIWSWSPFGSPDSCAFELIEPIRPEDRRRAPAAIVRLILADNERPALNDLRHYSDDVLPWARPGFPVVLVASFSQPAMHVRNVRAARRIAPCPIAISNSRVDQHIWIDAF